VDTYDIPGIAVIKLIKFLNLWFSSIYKQSFKTEPEQRSQSWPVHDIFVQLHGDLLVIKNEFP